MRKRESASGTMSEALNSAFPFVSPKGMESMVSADDEPVDFEHPTASPTQSVKSSAWLIKVPGAWLDTSRLKSFELDFIFASLPPNIGRQNCLPCQTLFHAA
jgi:hypothetical protein